MPVSDTYFLEVSANVSLEKFGKFSIFKLFC